MSRPVWRRGAIGCKPVVWWGTQSGFRTAWLLIAEVASKGVTIGQPPSSIATTWNCLIHGWLAIVC